MSRIEQIKAEQKKLADELKGEMLKEPANVLAKMKEYKNKHLQKI